MVYASTKTPVARRDGHLGRSLCFRHAIAPLAFASFLPEVDGDINTNVKNARKRLSPEESRETALEAARTLLLESGPQAVTLKAVAAAMGRTHANLLHHFGSAAGLQKALAARLAACVTAKIGAAVLRSREQDEDPREVVELAFDAFDREGAGALASWMLLNGNEDALDPILEAIHRLLDEIGPTDALGPEALRERTLQITLMALGDALLGGPMARALGLPRDRAREIAVRQLRDWAASAPVTALQD